MAKRRKVLPARKRADESGGDQSLLLRSAESLGRVIGALQRQLDDATRRLSETGGPGTRPKPAATRSRKKSTTRKPPARKAVGAGRKPTSARKKTAPR